MHIYIKKIEEIKNYIPDAETKRINAFQSEKRKIESLSGYFLLKSILKQRGYDAFQISRKTNEKPVLDIPLCYSLSHSGEYVVCAVDKNPFGLDIQIKTDKLLNIKRRTGETSKDITILTKHWALKEAYIKYINNNKIPLKEITIKGENPYILIYEEEAECKVFEYKNYIIALCMKSLKEVFIHD